MYSYNAIYSLIQDQFQFRSDKIILWNWADIFAAAVESLVLSKFLLAMRPFLSKSYTE